MLAVQEDPTMFELFTEEAQRALFFARAKTTERQGDVITPEDLLEGIFLSSPHVLTWFGSRLPDVPIETAQEFVSRLFGTRGALDAHASKEIPFSRAAQVALGRAAEEADELGHKEIRPEHLVLGILRDESSEASHTLNKGGVTLLQIRRIMANEPDEQS